MLFSNAFERKHNVMLLCNSWTISLTLHYVSVHMHY